MGQLLWRYATPITFINEDKLLTKIVCKTSGYKYGVGRRICIGGRIKVAPPTHFATITIQGAIFCADLFEKSAVVLFRVGGLYVQYNTHFASAHDLNTLG